MYKIGIQIVKTWFHKHSKHQTNEFLTQKSQMAASLVATKTPEEMQTILLKYNPWQSSWS